MITEPSSQSPRRALLFTPGDSPRKLEKVTQLAVDTVILDLEDAVAISQKEAARQTVVKSLMNLDFGETECLVRVNAPDTEFFTADCQALVPTKVAGLVIPKVETADQLHRATKILTGTPISLFALIETALGVMNLQEIAQTGPRLVALLFGAEDLTANLGASPSPDKWELLYARSAVVTAAAAYGLQAIDTVFTGLQDREGLARDSQFARQMGFTGKMAIHPQQVAIIQHVFSPTTAEIAQAQAIVTAYETHLATGSAVFTHNGRMVDKPVVRAAERVLARARTAHLL